MRFVPNTSLESLKAMETIHKSGAMVISESMAVARKSTARAGRSGSPMAEAPSTCEQEQEDGHHHQDEHERRRHRRGVAVFVELECLLVDVEDGERGRVGR